MSGYKREPRDLYQTPAWVTDTLVPHIPTRVRSIWEPAAGDGLMVAALKRAGYSVRATDISQGADFLRIHELSCDAIITNPPYAQAEEFIMHALSLNAFVAMLLRTDFDHAATRQHLFARNKSFAKKLVLTKRITWFERPGAAPSYNHAWFMWDRTHTGLPTLAYALDAKRVTHIAAIARE